MQLQLTLSHDVVNRYRFPTLEKDDFLLTSFLAEFTISSNAFGPDGIEDPRLELLRCELTTAFSFLFLVRLFFWALSLLSRWTPLSIFPFLSLRSLSLRSSPRTTSKTVRSLLYSRSLLLRGVAGGVVIACTTTSLVGAIVNSFQAMAPLTGPEKGVLLRGISPSKMGHFAPLLATIQALSRTRAFLLG
jgi:hypothetical protein